MASFESFKKALFKGDVNEVKKNFKTEFVEQYIDDLKRTKAIHCACEFGFIKIAELLIDSKCNMESENINKWKPIHYACRYGHVNVVKLLISHKCQIESESLYNMRPIHLAVRGGHIDIVMLLMSSRCNIDCEDIDKLKPINIAFDDGHLDIVKLLIEGKCKIPANLLSYGKISNLEENSTSSLCAEFIYKYNKMITDMKESNCKNFFEVFNSAISASPVNDVALSAFEIVLRQNFEKVVNMLMNRKLDDNEYNYLESVLCKIKNDGDRRLMIECILIRCIRDQQGKGFHKLCSADVINGKRRIISSFLETAAEFGCSAVLDQILKKSIYNKQTWDRAKNIAQQKGYQSIADEIAYREFVIVSRSKTNLTALHTAVWDNDIDVVKYVLDNNLCDINANHQVVGTALALAHSLCHIKCVSVLEQYKANANTQNKFLQTPLHEAITSGTTEYCEYLMENSNDIDKLGYNNLTALQCAVMQGSLDLCTRLMEHKANCTRFTNFAIQFKDDKTGAGNLNDVCSLTTRENALTLCLKINRTIYPCFLQVLDSNKSNCCDAFNNSLLHLASVSLQSEICKSLLEAKATVNALNQRGNTCLLELLLSTDCSVDTLDIEKVIETVTVLINFGSNICLKTCNGTTVFKCAAKFDDERLMLAIISKSYEHLDINEEDFKVAFSKHWFEYAESLIKLINTNTLSQYITKEIIKISLKHAESSLTKILFDRANSNTQQSILEDILYHCAINEEEGLYEHLLGKEVLSPKLFENGETLLTNLLKQKKRVFCFKLIKSESYKKFINLKNSKKQLPVQVSIEMEDTDIVDDLIWETDNINNEDQEGWTVLIQLFSRLSNCNDSNIKQKIMTTIKLVISRGGDIYLITSNGHKTIDSCSQSILKDEIERLYKVHASREGASSLQNRGNVSRNICPVCYDKEINCAFQCGHTICKACGENLFRCHMCQAEIINRFNIFI